MIFSRIFSIHTRHLFSREPPASAKSLLLLDLSRPDCPAATADVVIVSAAAEGGFVCLNKN